jgi:hypothetical protein
MSIFPIRDLNGHPAGLRAAGTGRVIWFAAAALKESTRTHHARHNRGGAWSQTRLSQELRDPFVDRHLLSSSHLLSNRQNT